MAYKFKPNEAAGEGIRRMAIEQIDRALAEVADSGLNRHDTVHQARKRCKKLRALLRLARGDLDTDCKVYSQENACFRDAARSLSRLRDAEALLETHDTLKERFSKQANWQRLEKVRDVLEERRRGIAEEESNPNERLAAVAETLRSARERVGDWPVGDGFDALAPGLEKTYQRGRKAMARCGKNPETDALHEWRKRVKYHRYHIRVLRPIWKNVLNEWRHALHDLSNDLGEDHDLAVFTQALSREADRFPSERDLQCLLGLAEHRRAELQKQAFRRGERLFVEKPKAYRRRIAAYWHAANG